MRALTASLLFVCLSTTVVAQSNYKESSNSFARYTVKGEIKELENAKKFIDAAYKTKRDSSSTKNNLLRAMVYSSLAYADSTRKIKADKDHIDITNDALSRVNPKDLSRSENEVNYINQNLIAAYIFKANKQIEKKEFENAYNSFLEVERLGSQSEDVLRNLAFLSAEAGKITEAINFYKKLVSSDKSQPITYISLAKLYRKNKDNQSYLNTLQEARELFPSDKTILFLLIESFSENKTYQAITPIIEEALKYEPNNLELFYLAGFASENVGNIVDAKKYYGKVLDLDDNNYDANLALGLIHLNEFLADSNNLEAQYLAHDYLLKANGIKPYAVNALKGLALFYEKAEDQEQLDRVNTLLNQISDN
ncbi:tetratricopeptide repeat protein [Sphingobacterium bovistauri]|uniref:Tetratricopeptide repeat protein n=1 Tax=Sphingobacterium bovistauri TaxID=2781959 RepID=A0ABS7Z5T0_9SPHI|nr:tetratricopeptide repeat protein [Sphingobacterium bovistauri]MCA5005533.1 tetratricopeptide repeat protein [Sphingobacterium bovistauri]